MAGLLIGVASGANAGYIRSYQETAIASGSIGGVTFTNAHIELTANADTANIQVGNVLNTTYYSVSNIGLTIKIEGIGTATFLHSTRTLTYPFNQAGFYDDGVGFILLTYNSVLANYNLDSDIGPIAPEGGGYMSDFRVSPTTLGPLQFSYPFALPPTFISPAPVPEPSSLILTAAGIAATIPVLMRRRRSA